jgi:hypothetical protein
MPPDDGNTPARVPKYKAADFMAKEIALFHQARFETRLMRRYGDNDAGVPAVMPIAAVRSVWPVQRAGSRLR